MSSFIPIYYQILTSYRPLSSHQVTITTPAPSPSILGTISRSKIPRPLTLVFIGDSMIDTIFSQNSIVDTNLKNFNYGFGSTTIDSAAKRLTNQTIYRDLVKPPITSLKPDIIVIESFAYNNYGNTENGLVKYQTELTALISKIKQLLPNSKIILASTITPNASVFATGQGFTPQEQLEKTETIKKYQSTFIQYATTNHYPLVDITTITKQKPTNFISSDGIHPNSTGAQTFFDTLTQVLIENSDTFN